jgi:tripartite-type tricarboxylate transporter receptor subunit TctC
MTTVFNSARSAVCLLAALAACASLGAAAQDADRPHGYPAKPVRILLGISPGGGTDVVTRAVAQKLTERWGRPFIVDNRPGAAGTVAMELTAQARPDGYTLYVATLNNVASASILKKVAFDTTKAYTPVVVLDTQPYLLVVTPALPVNDFKEFVAYAKSRPGALNYGSSGVGTASHLGMELLKSRTGIDITHIAYKGASLVAVDLISGQVQVLMGSSVTVAPHVRSGKIKALGVTGLRRSAVYPDLPTIAESGVPGFEVTNSHGVFAPAGTPATIVTALNRAAVTIMRSPDIVSKLAHDGAEPVPPNTPAEFKAAFLNEVASWRTFFREHPDLVRTSK